MDCPFCIPEHDKDRILENRETCYAILSNPRLMPGHTLIVPRRHIEKPSELTEAERKEIFDTIIEYQERILTRYASGCDITEHFRPFIPQSQVKVNHLHFHIRPREFKDGLYETSQKFEVFEPLMDEERAKFTELLK